MVLCFPLVLFWILKEEEDFLPGEEESQRQMKTGGGNEY